MTPRRPALAQAFTPRPRELLSGYLCRTARRHGMAPSRFASFFLGCQHVWARDVDRGESDFEWSRWSTLFHLKASDIELMTFRRWVDLSSRASSRWRCANLTAIPASRPGPKPAVSPWINVAGVYHRTRFRHGLQFCSSCLGREETIDRRWRLSFALQCPEHGVPLTDGCPNCDAPFVLHRCTRWPYLCHVCRQPLASSRGPALPLLDGNAATLLGIQNRLDSALSRCESGDETAVSETTGRTTLEWALGELIGLRWLTGILLQRANAERTLSMLDIDPANAAKASRRLENARTAWRAAVMLALARLRADWPNSFRRCAAALRMTQRTDNTRTTLPPWLTDEIRLLCPGGRQRGGSRRVEALAERLKQLRRDAAPGWRDEHAALMLRAARRPR